LRAFEAALVQPSAAGHIVAGVSRAFPQMRHPIIQAPMAGGPSTPALAAAVSAAGGLGFLAAGYRTPAALAADMATVREITAAAIGVNLFLLVEAPVDAAALAAYAREIEPDAHRHGVVLGDPHFDDDSFDEKVEVVCRERPEVVSFTFGCPEPALVSRLQGLGIAVWVTVTEVDEALLAAAAGADALIAQGAEAGGHRGSFDDEDGRGEIALLPLLRLVARSCELPIVASGGIADGAAVAAVLAAGAVAAQLGTAFMRCPEAGTSAPHRDSLETATPTALTRAFSGRRARGIVNAFMNDHDDGAPSAYPHVNHLTAPLRAAARQARDAGSLNLWAGQAHALAESRPAAELVRQLGGEARTAIEQARARLER
jgi:nitronate monooxygenase